MITSVLNSIRLFFARRDLELAIYEEAQLRREAFLATNDASRFAEEAQYYRKHLIPYREARLRECETAKLADKIGRM